MRITQRDRVLLALTRKAGHLNPWICGVDFVEGRYDPAHRFESAPAILRYSAVIGKLRGEGVTIEGGQCPDHATYRFRLVTEQAALW